MSGGMTSLAAELIAGGAPYKAGQPVEAAARGIAGEVKTYRRADDGTWLYTIRTSGGRTVEDIPAEELALDYADNRPS